MEYSFCFHGTMPSLNEYLGAERVVKHGRYGGIQTGGNKMKHEYQNYLLVAIRKQLRGVKVKKPVVIHYKFYEPTARRDVDNIASVAMKFIQDALVLSGVLENDSQRFIKGFTCDFGIDRKNPRILVTLEELEEE